MNDARWFGYTIVVMLLAGGGYMAMWPEDAALRQKESEDKAPVTVAEVRRMRMIGLAFIVCGGVLLWATLTGLLQGGAVDPVLF